ncbi:Tubulin--tyrosine ligase-like protein 12 [Globodera pallida]|nr:Tubulin--tyrosine ligase-like protein 12 [Globodera pallida]
MTQLLSYKQFLQIHEPQLLAAGLPELFWKNLHEKLANQIFDAGKYFEVIIEENNDPNETISSQVKALSDLRVDDPKNVFLIDHAWTFRPNSARNALRQVDGLRKRLTDMFNIKVAADDPSSSYFFAGDDPSMGADCESSSAGNDQNGDGLTEQSQGAVDDRIMDEIWKYAMTYSVRIRNAEMDEGQIPLWYLMDEFGIRIGHSLQPNAKMVPFLNLSDQMTYSLLFPVQNVSADDIVTRNYVDTQLAKDHPDWFDVLLHPWQPDDNFAGRPICHAPKTNEYFMSGRLHDLVPSGEQGAKTNFRKSVDDPNILVCASDLQLIEKLRRISVEETTDPMRADIIWRRDHFNDFRLLAEQNPGALINQFPFEAILTVKDLFAAAVQSFIDEQQNGLNVVQLVDELSLRWAPQWFPLTFNLSMELPQFVAYFQRRAKKNLDNCWIVKPWNLARGMDTHVTRNLNSIIRQAESGPKIVSKYIENPLLFRRLDSGNLVKFDLRYIVFVRQLCEPIDIVVFNQFWIRFAIHEYNLRNLDDHFAHLTVHQYGDNKANVYQLRCDEFVGQLCKQYPKLRWPEVQEKINAVIVEVFRVVTKNSPPRGIAPNRQSRAMYGLDLMLHWRDHDDSDALCARPPVDELGAEDVSVAFIEANFMPDCERACQYYGDFADIAFETLFFGKTDPERVTKLSFSQ